MMITAGYLHYKWGEFNFHDGGFIRIDMDLVLESYLGFQDINQKTFMVLSKAEPKMLPQSKSIVVNKGKRADGRWTLTFTLMRLEQENVFETLCADIIMYYAEAKEEQEALHLIEQRFKQWNILLQNYKKALMNESARKGLIGELLFLLSKVEELDAVSAVKGWVGPDGADQDFVYADKWYEVKATGVASSSVKISSLEQLDRDDPGELIVMRIDKCAPERRGAVSLVQAVAQVRCSVQNNADALSLLDQKLIRYGYIDLPEYREQKYYFSGKERFKVDEGFPKLTSSAVPAQIDSAQYAISLAGIESWKLED